MKKQWFICGAVGMVLIITFCGVSVLAKERNENEGKEMPVAWEKVPIPVQQAFQVQLGSDHPEQITSEMDDGFVTYEATKNVNGQEKEVKLCDNGQLMEIEDAIPVSSLPVAVKDAIEKKIPKTEIKEIRRVTCYYYEFEYGEGKNAKELKMLGNGQEYDAED